MPVYVSDLLTATAAPVNAVPTATRTWQWLRGSTAISGATSSTYTAVTADIGATIAASQIETNVAGTATATSAATEVIQAFDPIRLFSASEPGVWYDPNDISTLFKGPTPVAPVTTPGDAVYLMADKSRGGQGPDAVVNGDFATGDLTGWSVVGSVVTSVTNGELYINRSNRAFTEYPTQTILTSGKTYLVSFDVISRSSFVSAFFGGITNKLTTAGVGSFVGIITATGPNFFIGPDGSGNAFCTIDNISVKELPGNHATQSITASQPIYGIVPAGGRRNLLEQTEAFDAASWVKTAVTLTSLPTELNPLGATGGVFRLQIAGGATASITQALVLNWAVASNIAFYVKQNGVSSSKFRLFLAGNQLSSDFTATTSWVRYQFSGTRAVADSRTIGLNNPSDTTAVDILIWGAQLEQSATATPYQRVTTQYDVTEAGVASLGYLYFDGTDDFMVTPVTVSTLNLNIWSGHRQTGLAVTNGRVLSISDSTGNINNLGLISNGGSPSSNSVGYRWPENLSVALGQTNNNPVVIHYQRPSVSLQTARRNGVDVTPNTGTTTTFTNSTARIGCGFADSTNLPFFNGQIFALIVRGAASTTARISATESWVASKTAGVTL